MSDPRLRSLLRQANKVASNGKLAAAEQLYRQILDEFPEAPDAWVGLASVLRDSSEAEAAFQRAYDLDPANKAAKAGLRGETVKLPPPELPVAPNPVPDPVPAQLQAAKEMYESVKTVATEEPPVVPAAAVITEAAEFDLVCYRHPSRQTGLRCYTCGKPICIKCAKKTPVGYSCPDCIRNLQDSYFTAKFIDYILAFTAALPLSLVAAYISTWLGFFVFFVAPVIGTVLGRIIFFVVRRRRGRWLPHLVAATLVMGAGLFILLGFGSLIWTGLYAILAAASAYYFMKV